MSVTQLRKNIFDVVEAARVNKQITRIMLRGEVVAEIGPKKVVKKTKSTFLDLVKSFPKQESMTVEEMDMAYRVAMEKKHGKYISGRK
jgi:hypothetical protein